MYKHVHTHTHNALSQVEQIEILKERGKNPSFCLDMRKLKFESFAKLITRHVFVTNIFIQPNNAEKFHSGTKEDKFQF